MPRVFPVVIGLAAVVSSAVVHGLWTDRWSPPREPAMGAAQLSVVPMSVGDWDSRASDLDAQTLAVGEITGYMNRVFTHRHTGQQLSVLIVCGRPGPIAQHSPEVCMGGEGFEPIHKTRHVLPAEGLSKPAEFWAAVFRKFDGSLPLYRRVFWAWSSDGAWEAPDSPRLRYAGRKVLYKLYIVHPMAQQDEPLDQDPAHDLARDLLPVLQKTLFEKS